MTITLYVIIVLFIGCLPGTGSYKIMLYPCNMMSSFTTYTEFGSALTENHEVHMLIPSNANFTSTDNDINIVTYPVSQPEPYMGSQQQAQLVFETVNVGYIQWMRTFKEMMSKIREDYVKDCEDVLNNEAFFNSLKEAKYDLIVMDFGDLNCKPAFVYKLGVPTVLLSLKYMQWFYRVPNLPSITPTVISQSTDVMSFGERFKNFLNEVTSGGVMSASNHYVEKYVPEKEFKPPMEILRSSLLWFYLHDTVLQYPSPVMPNTIDIGGLMHRDGKPLPEDYDTLLKGARHGVILMTFGSYIKYLPEKWVLKFCEAFNKLDRNILVIWKTDVPSCSLPRNVITRPWVPQNDLLAHDKVKLFITHCGWNSYMEAGYHGTPMIAFPLIADQPHHAVVMESKGLGVRMDIADFSAEHLVANIYIVMHNQTFVRSSKRIAQKLRHTEIPVKKKIQFWVEHVIKFGGEHLRTGGYKLSDREFLMLDILAVIGLGIMGICGCILLFCCCMFKTVKYCCCTSEEKVKIKQN